MINDFISGTLIWLFTKIQILLSNIQSLLHGNLRFLCYCESVHSDSITTKTCWQVTIPMNKKISNSELHMNGYWLFLSINWSYGVAIQYFQMPTLILCSSYGFLSHFPCILSSVLQHFIIMLITMMKQGHKM